MLPGQEKLYKKSKQTNKKQTRKRKIFSNAEIQCLEQNSMVLMLTAERAPEFFPLFFEGCEVTHFPLN